MRIVFVTEFGQDDNFQWRWSWDLDAQIKRKTLVESVIINPAVLSKYDDNHAYWNPLRKADIVFVYASRTHTPNFQYTRSQHNNSVVYYWNWWELPKIAKTYMREDAKMIAQIDDDWVWLQHPEWTWWEDLPDNQGGPEEFFKNTGILEIPDIWWTVLDNPFWTQFTTKPVMYMPLPQLYRYYDEITKSEQRFKTYGALRMHGKNLALLKHSSRTASINHLIKNVAEKVNVPVTYFSTQWTDPAIPKFKVPVKTYLWLGRSQYMEKLRDDCFIAIDDAKHYMGWSRFAMECAINYVPCVGSNHAVKLFFPDLYVKHNNTAEQIRLINKLRQDENFYNEVAVKGRYLVLNHLDSDNLMNSMVNIAKGLNPNVMPIDVDIEMLKSLLRKTLPFSIIPCKPNENQNIWDELHHRMCDREQWEKWYGLFEKFISDEKQYRCIIQEVLSEKC